MVQLSIIVSTISFPFSKPLYVVQQHSEKDGVEEVLAKILRRLGVSIKDLKLKKVIDLFRRKRELKHDLLEVLVVLFVAELLFAYTPRNVIPQGYILLGALAVMGFIFLSNIRKASPYIFSLLSWSFGILSLWILLTYSISVAPLEVIGATFVEKEIDIMPYFFIKPITLFCFTAFLSFGFGLFTPYWKRKFLDMAPEMRVVLMVAAGVVAMGCAFEIWYHISLWAALLTLQGAKNPDVLVNPFPKGEIPINITFALKVITLIAGLAIFSIIYLLLIEWELRHRETLTITNNQKRAPAGKVTE